MGTENKGPFRDFVDGFNEAYEAEDKKLREDEKDLVKQVKEGVVEGAVNSLLNPFTWFRQLFK